MTGSIIVLGYGLTVVGVGIGVGLVFMAFVNGVARQPEARSSLQSAAFLGFAGIEALAMLGMVLVFAAPD
jgi:F-type H+-transporting ATPase subunit c